MSSWPAIRSSTALDSGGVRLPIGGASAATFASPEDVIVKKLQYYQEGGSEKHLRDIVGVLKVQGERINRAYLTEWVNRLNLVPEWQLVEARLGEAAGSATNWTLAFPLCVNSLNLIVRPCFSGELSAAGLLEEGVPA